MRMGTSGAIERRHPPTALMRVINPVTRRLVARGAAADAVLVLHYVGRRSGRRFDTPAGFHRIDGVLTVFTNSPWRHNFAGGVAIEVTLAGERVPAHAELVAEPEAVAAMYQQVFEQLGWRAAQRRLGVKVHVGRQPTLEEILDAVRRSGLAAVEIRPR
jgi:hypothetical protein